MPRFQTEIRSIDEHGLCCAASDLLDTPDQLWAIADARIWVDGAKPNGPTREAYVRDLDTNTVVYGIGSWRPSIAHYHTTLASATLWERAERAGVL